MGDATSVFCSKSSAAEQKRRCFLDYKKNRNILDKNKPFSPNVENNGEGKSKA